MSTRFPTISFDELSRLHGIEPEELKAELLEVAKERGIPIGPLPGTTMYTWPWFLALFSSHDFDQLLWKAGFWPTGEPEPVGGFSRRKEAHEPEAP